MPGPGGRRLVVAELLGGRAAAAPGVRLPAAFLERRVWALDAEERVDRVAMPRGNAEAQLNQGGLIVLRGEQPNVSRCPAADLGGDHRIGQEHEEAGVQQSCGYDQTRVNRDRQFSYCFGKCADELRPQIAPDMDHCHGDSKPRSIEQQPGCETGGPVSIRGRSFTSATDGGLPACHGEAAEHAALQGELREDQREQHHQPGGNLGG